MSKVVCVDSDCAKHIRGMGSAVPEELVLFIKPEAALCDLRQPLAIPSDLGSVHHEVELVVLIDTTLCRATEKYVRKATADHDVVLDLTLRDVQRKIRRAGQSWGKAKAFDSPCPLSGFTPTTEFVGDPQNTALDPSVNGEQRQ